MPKYNLNDRQREIVRQLVDVYGNGFQDQFNWFPELGSEPAITFSGRSESIKASKADLITLDREQFVTLSPDRQGYGYFGTLRQRAYEAVETDFEQPSPKSIDGGLNIGNYIQSMSGGNAQGAAGSHISMTQNVHLDVNELMERFDDLTDQLTEVFTRSLRGSELRGALTEISAIGGAVKATDPDMDVVVKKSRSLGERLFSLLDIGDKTSGTIQTAIYATEALVVLGGWLNTAYQIVQQIAR